MAKPSIDVATKPKLAAMATVAEKLEGIPVVLKGTETLKDYAGMNPEAARVMGMKTENAIILDKNQSDTVETKNLVHEVVETEEMKQGKAYFPGHLDALKAEETVKTPAELVKKVEEIREKKEPWQMSQDEWNKATRFYYSGKSRNAETPSGERIILKSGTPITFRESSADFLKTVRRQDVAKALKEGKPVPDDVLKDYPDLKINAEPTQVVKVHDDGDLTVKKGDTNFVVTTEGQTFKEVKPGPELKEAVHTSHELGEKAAGTKEPWETKNISQLAKKIEHAKTESQKNNLFLSVYGKDRDALLQHIILSMPKKKYLLKREGFVSPSLEREIINKYGTMAGTHDLEKTVRGLSAIYPDKISANFTLGLDELELKQATRGGQTESHSAHNAEKAGPTPAPATNQGRYTIEELRRIEAQRSKRSQSIDESRLNAKVISPNSPAVEQWVKHPGQYDIKGVDAPKGSPITVQAPAGHWTKEDGKWKFIKNETHHNAKIPGRLSSMPHPVKLNQGEKPRRAAKPGLSVKREGQIIHIKGIGVARRMPKGRISRKR